MQSFNVCTQHKCIIILSQKLQTKAVMSWEMVKMSLIMAPFHSYTDKINVTYNAQETQIHV